MPPRTIVRLGHPALRSPAEPVREADFGSPELAELVRDMEETLREADGVGLAAPQLGISLQLFLWLSDPAEGSALAVVNPMLEPEPGELVYDWEGCLSIPALRGLVPRHPAVRLRGFDPAGRPVDRPVRDLEARIVQHEYDHLNGVVFLDRMHDLRSLAFEQEWLRFLAVDEEDGAS